MQIMVVSGSMCVIFFFQFTIKSEKLGGGEFRFKMYITEHQRCSKY